MNKLTISCVLCLLTVFVAFADSDHVILRNGLEDDVRLYQINDERIVFSYDKGKNSQRHEIPSKNVYMVYIEGQGNVYFTPEGKRFTGEPRKVNPSKFDVIYLVEGREIAAENIRITADQILYDVKGSTSHGLAGLKSKSKVTEERVDKSAVFMIRYKNGMSDVITPIDVVEEVIEEPQVEEVDEAAEPEYIVVFHEVKRGETLQAIGKLYDVDPQMLIEWNDLPSNQKITSALKVGMQLLIYQPKN